MTTARVRKSASSLAWYFSWTALTDSASMRAWAGSYTPQGRSQWALTLTLGANRRVNMAVLPRDRLSGGTLLPGGVVFSGAPGGLGQKSGATLGGGGETNQEAEDAGAGGQAVLAAGRGHWSVDGTHTAARGLAADPKGQQRRRAGARGGCRGAAAPAAAGSADRQTGRRTARGRLVGDGGQRVRGERQPGVRHRSRRAGAGQSPGAVPAAPGGSALGDRRGVLGHLGGVLRTAAARGPLVLQALAGPIGGHIGPGGTPVRAVAAGPVRRRVDVRVPARHRLADAEPVRPQRGELHRQAHAGAGRVAGGGVGRVVGEVHVPVGAPGVLVEEVVPGDLRADRELQHQLVEQVDRPDLVTLVGRLEDPAQPDPYRPQPRHIGVGRPGGGLRSGPAQLPHRLHGGQRIGAAQWLLAVHEAHREVRVISQFHLWSLRGAV